MAVLNYCAFFSLAERRDPFVTTWRRPESIPIDTAAADDDEDVEDDDNGNEDDNEKDDKHDVKDEDDNNEDNGSAALLAVHWLAVLSLAAHWFAAPFYLEAALSLAAPFYPEAAFWFAALCLAAPFYLEAPHLLAAWFLWQSRVLIITRRGKEFHARERPRSLSLSLSLSPSLSLVSNCIPRPKLKGNILKGVDQRVLPSFSYPTTRHFRFQSCRFFFFFFLTPLFGCPREIFFPVIV